MALYPTAVPGFRELPLSRRLRVLALGALSDGLSSNLVASGARRTRAALPPFVSSAIRRAAAPIRLPAASRAHLPVDAIEPVRRRPTGQPEVSIVIATAGAPTLEQCVRAIAAFTSHPYELVIVDDASPNRVADRLTAVDAHLIRNASRRGFVASANRGAAAARCDTLVFLNDDAVVTPGWLEALMKSLELPRAGIAGPANNDSGDAATVEVRYEDLHGLLEVAGTKRGPPRDVVKISLLCAAIRRPLFEAIGGLDEGYGLGMFEDDEICMAVRRRGRRVLLVPDAFVHHHGSMSFRALPKIERLARFEVNRYRFERRWGVRWRAPATPVR